MPNIFQQGKPMSKRVVPFLTKTKSSRPATPASLAQITDGDKTHSNDEKVILKHKRFIATLRNALADCNSDDYHELLTAYAQTQLHNKHLLDKTFDSSTQPTSSSTSNRSTPITARIHSQPSIATVAFNASRPANTQSHNPMSTRTATKSIMKYPKKKLSPKELVAECLTRTATLEEAVTIARNAMSGKHSPDVGTFLMMPLNDFENAVFLAENETYEEGMDASWYSLLMPRYSKYYSRELNDLILRRQGTSLEETEQVMKHQPHVIFQKIKDDRHRQQQQDLIAYVRLRDKLKASMSDGSKPPQITAEVVDK